jgi:6-pyruvoyltetrahydropterin/6-carboxytetrahydropterin synthase
MVVDFSFLGFLLKTFVHDIYDHSFIVHKDDKELLEALSGHDWRIVEFPYVPTAENLARYIYNALKTEVMELSDGRAQLSMVTVWETPTSVAMYAEDA